MAMNIIGRNRMDAVWRVSALVLYFLVGWIITAVAFGAGLVWMVIDVIVQIITNNQGWSTGGTGAKGWLYRLYQWHIDLTEWILFGKGSFPWMP